MFIRHNYSSFYLQTKQAMFDYFLIMVVTKEKDFWVKQIKIKEKVIWLLYYVGKIYEP
jgi:hypothetical protein